MKPTIEVIISPAGEIIIDALGFKGADCEHATSYLERALGVVRQKDRKPDYHNRRESRRQQRIGA